MYLIHSVFKVFTTEAELGMIINTTPLNHMTPAYLSSLVTSPMQKINGVFKMPFYYFSTKPYDVAFYRDVSSDLSHQSVR